MTARRDLIGQLAAVIDDIGVIAAPADAVQELTALCRITRVATAGASVSVARLDGSELVYEAADGAGRGGHRDHSLADLAGDRRVRRPDRSSHDRGTGRRRPALRP